VQLATVQDLGEGNAPSILPGARSIDISPPRVDIAPRGIVARCGLEWNGISSEFVQATANDRVDFSFRSSVHLLAAYDQGVRRDGESWVEGAPRSTLRDLFGKLTFVPAGRAYREWHALRTPASLTFFYFEPQKLLLDSEEGSADTSLAPRLFFEDTTIASMTAKLKEAVAAQQSVNRLYIEALGVVLFHELLCLNGGAQRTEGLVKGGLATWQQRIVAAYIEEHLSDQIPLAVLARLTRLSRFHFCYAFKQSFGVPPHRYHTNRRIAQAKVMWPSESAP
jgi:AraC family transcriptional regulator